MQFQTSIPSAFKTHFASAGKCPENPNAWAFALVPSEAAEGEQVRESIIEVFNRGLGSSFLQRQHLTALCVQVKAGVVQSSGIVSISSVPYGDYKVTHKT